MRILIYGAGAIGCLIGGLLARANQVGLYSRDQAHMDEIARNGLRISGIIKTHTRPIVVGSPIEFLDPDLILLPIKSYDTLNAANELANLPLDCPIISLQNGVGNVEMLQIALGRNRVIGGMTSMGSILKAPGKVEHNGYGDLVFGYPDGGRTPLLDRFITALEASKLPAEVTDNINGHLWLKAAANCSINPLSALTGRTNGQIPKSAELRELIRLISDECEAVLTGAGITLPESDIEAKTLSIIKNTYHNRSSMLTDVECGRRTEIEAITGSFVEHGKKLGIPTPVNETLLGLILGFGSRIERGRIEEISNNKSC